MIYSMTGYGKGAAEADGISAEVEVKSINSRYLDIFMKLPQSLLSKDYELRELIKSKIKRGKISVFSLVKKTGQMGDIPVIDKGKLKELIGFIKELKKSAKINEKIKLDHLLNLKDIFLAAEEVSSDIEFELIKKALDAALDELLTMKKNEGGQLARDLKQRVKTIEDKLNGIERESSESVKEYFEKFKEKAKALVKDITPYSDRLELELALLAEKSEITEECVRLRSHIKFFMESLTKEDDPGRKLNFLCQEMNREVNTISAKTLSTFITHSTVVIKEEIEKMREQIQNIE
ncbi:MAG TPA: YicC/YloC family endoribonuclease [Ignavibacteriaceae bacterium]|nr:YicC/YloC family endoribonuclease [Ignavibacteriaceae bacterium]